MSLCSSYTIRLPISETLTGTYEGVTRMCLRCVVIELWILLHILLLINIYICVRTLKTLKLCSYAALVK